MRVVGQEEQRGENGASGGGAGNLGLKGGYSQKIYEEA